MKKWGHIVLIIAGIIASIKGALDIIDYNVFSGLGFQKHESS